MNSRKPGILLSIVNFVVVVIFDNLSHVETAKYYKFSLKLPH